MPPPGVAFFTMSMDGRYAGNAGTIAGDKGAFLDYNGRFADVTRRAQRHFERRDWRQAQRDSALRIDLYGVNKHPVLVDTSAQHPRQADLAFERAQPIAVDAELVGRLPLRARLFR